MIRAGEFRYRINIYSITRTPNEYGEPSKSLTLYNSVRAARKFIGGTTSEIDEQMVPQQTVEFKVRFDFNLVEDMVVMFSGNKYQVMYVFHTYEYATTMRCKLIKDDNFGEPKTE